MTEERTAAEEPQDDDATTVSDSSPADTVADPNNETLRLHQELGEARDKYLRLYSEFENFRRRTARERIDVVNSATQELMVALLPVIDDSHRAQQALESAPDLQAARDGFQLVFQKLYKTLEQKGLRSMDIKTGDAFDAEQQEAVTQFPAPSDELRGKVVDVLERGYFLHDKPIRFAKVVTGS